MWAYDGLEDETETLRLFSSSDLQEKAVGKACWRVLHTRCHPPASLHTLVAVKVKRGEGTVKSKHLICTSSPEYESANPPH